MARRKEKSRAIQGLHTRQVDSRQDAYEFERKLQKAVKVKTNPMYVNMAYGHKLTAGGWNKGVTAWNKGRPMSDETKRRVSESKKNPSEETRRKMREAARRQIRRPHSPESLAKIRAAKAGTKPVSAGWNKGLKDVYSKEVLEGWSRKRMGVPNPKNADHNRLRAGIPRRRKGESDESLQARKAAALAHAAAGQPKTYLPLGTEVFDRRLKENKTEADRLTTNRPWRAILRDQSAK
jgi:hypothetical protein